MKTTLNKGMVMIALVQSCRGTAHETLKDRMRQMEESR
jgi:hypothetical protein